MEQLGTAHAVLQCKEILGNFNGNVLILYGDVPLIEIETLKKLLLLHNKEFSQSTILTTELPNPYGYGRIIRNIDNNLQKIVEEKDASKQQKNICEINSGIYVFKAPTLFNLLPLVKNNNSQNEYYLPDVLNMLISKKEKVAIEKINNYFEIQGVNSIEQLNEINRIYEK